jgi:hypothetical protein
MLCLKNLAGKKIFTLMCVGFGEVGHEVFYENKWLEMFFYD